MVLPELSSKDTLRKLWWLHDSFWHAAIVKELGVERANQLNLEVSEKISRMLAIILVREKIIRRPRSIQELMGVFKVFWKNAFFDDLYINEHIEYEGDTAVYTGMRCHAYTSLSKARMLEGYECACQAVRNGVFKALRLKPLHRIEESLVRGDGRCVIRITFSPTV
jgi:hypothetical protein